MKSLFLLLLISFISVSLKAEKSERTIKKSFVATNVEKVFIENRYGKVDIKQSDISEVKFNILISINSEKPGVADDLLSQIDVEFVEKSSYLTVNTSFADNFSFRKLLNKMFSGGKVKIDYNVEIPKGKTLSIVNRNGDVFAGDYLGKLNVDVKRGDVKFGNISKACELNIEGGRLDVERVSEGKFLLKASKMFLDEGEFISIDSKDSEIKIEKANELNITSKSGKCFIGEVEVLRGSSNLTKFEVNDIGDELVFELWFGSMNIRNIHNMFSLVDVKTTRARMGLTFMKGASYDLEIRHSKNVKLDLPDGLDINKRNAAEKRTFISEAKVGGKNKFGSKVKINATGCKLFIQ